MCREGFFHDRRNFAVFPGCAELHDFRCPSATLNGRSRLVKTEGEIDKEKRIKRALKCAMRLLDYEQSREQSLFLLRDSQGKRTSVESSATLKRDTRVE